MSDPNRQFISTPIGDVAVVDHGGDGPPVVVMHGYPDDSRIYDRLVPLLAAVRLITVDFVGYGRASRLPQPNPDRVGEIAAVIDALDVEHAVLVGHDASVPTAIDFALAYPGRVLALILMNGFYGTAPSLRFPELIRLLADPNLVPLADALLDDADQRLWLLGHTARRFGLEPLNADGVGTKSVLPQFFGDDFQPDALEAIRFWTASLFNDLRRQDHCIAAGRLATMFCPIHLPWGADDPYLNVGVAQHISYLLPNAKLELIENASHWPQWDRPNVVAATILQAARPNAEFLTNSRLLESGRRRRPT